MLPVYRSWGLDSGRTGLIPNWLQFVAPWNGSNFFAFTFAGSGFGAGDDPQPFSVSFRGTTKFTRSFLITRGEAVTTPPQVESVDQSVTVLAVMQRSVPLTKRFVDNRQAFDISALPNGNMTLRNVAPALGRVVLESGETLELDCTANGNSDGECQMGIASQRNIVHVGSALIVQSGTLRIVSSVFIFGAITVAQGANLIFDAHDTCIAGRMDRHVVANDGMVFVNSGSVLFQTGFSGDGGLNIGPGAAAVLHSPNAQSVFATSPLNNGGNNYANGLLTFQSGVCAFTSPLQGVGQIIIGEAANVKFDGTPDPNPTVIAFDQLTNTSQYSRTTHAFVTGAMVSTLMAMSGAVPPVAVQNFGLLQVMPLARVVAYRLLKSGGSRVASAGSAVAGQTATVSAVTGRLVIESGGELILDTASNATAPMGSGSSTGADATQTTSATGTGAATAAPTRTGDGPLAAADAFSELTGDGAWSGGKLILLSGKLRVSSPLRQRGAGALLELSISTEFHHDLAPDATTTLDGTGAVSGLVSAGAIYVTTGTLKVLSPTRSLAVMIVSASAAVVFDQSADPLADVPVTFALNNFGLMNSGAVTFRGGQAILSGPVVSNGSVTVLPYALVDFNCATNQSLIAGSGLTHSGGVITVRRGDVIFASPFVGSAAPSDVNSAQDPAVARIDVWPPQADGTGPARLVFTTNPSPSISASSANATASGIPVPQTVHVIAGYGLSNAGTTVVQDAALVLRGALYQSGQLLVATVASNVTFANFVESVVLNTTLPDANASIACLGPATVSAGARLRLRGSRSAWNGGLTVAGWLTLDGGAAATTTLYRQSADGAVLTVTGGAALQSTGATGAECRIARGLVRGSGGVISCPRTVFEPAAALGPGLSPGNLTFAGDLVLLPDAKYLADVWGRMAGSTYDQVLVSGTATVDGAIVVVDAGARDVLFPADSAPPTSNRPGQPPVPRAALFAVLLARAISGKFASALIAANPNVTVSLEYTPQSVSALIAEKEMADYTSAAARRAALLVALLVFLVVPAFLIPFAFSFVYT